MVRLSPRFLTALIIALFIVPFGFAAINDGTIEAHYNLSNLLDSSGNGRSLTNAGAVSFVPGIIGNGASNFSSANVLNRTGEAWMNCVQTARNCTVNMWFNITSAPTFSALFGHSTNPDTGGQSFLTVDGGTGTLIYYQYNGGGYDTATGTTTINQNQWYMVTLAFNSSTVSMYVNSVNESSVGLVGADLTAPLSIGYDQHQGEFPGIIDEVTFANRTWTQAEITSMYNAGAGLAYPFGAAPANTPPVLQTASIALTSNNATILLTGNATDTDNASIFYSYTIQRNGVNISSANTTFFTQGVSRNFANVSTGSVNGNYTAYVSANDGVNASNTILTNTVEATFNTTPANTPPVLQSASISISGDNQTITPIANATDADLNTVSYHYDVFRNNILVGSSTSGFVTQGVTTTLATYNVGGINGTYVLNVTATDGTNTSNLITTNSITATFGTPPVTSDDLAIGDLINFVIGAGLLIILLILGATFFPEKQQLLYMGAIGIFVIILLATLIVLI